MKGIAWVRQAIAEREAMNMHFGQFEFLALAGLGHGKGLMRAVVGNYRLINT